LALQREVGMTRFVILRSLRAVLTLLAISVVTFALFFILPANPAQLMCGRQCNPQNVAQLKHSLGIDQPITTQYVEFVKGVFVGRDIGEGEFAVHCSAPCLGYSFRGHELVTSTLARTVPVTVSIVIPAAILWILFGTALGMFSALRRGTIFDKLSIGVSLVGASLQVPFFGLVLLGIFVYGLRLMPYPQYVSLFSNPAGWLQAMILPWITLAFLNAAIYARLSRAQMLETLSEDYIRTARAKGVPRRTVHIRHALRAAVNPIVTVAGLEIGLSLGGAILTETVFSLNGLGFTSVNAVQNEDLPVVLATVLVAAVFIVIANIVVDALYASIDPRVRLGS
jgi:peptide/nickel transport system permease protein